MAKKNTTEAAPAATKRSASELHDLIVEKHGGYRVAKTATGYAVLGCSARKLPNGTLTTGYTLGAGATEAEALTAAADAERSIPVPT